MTLNPRDELIKNLIILIGSDIERLGQEIRHDAFAGLAQKVERLHHLLEAIGSAEKMRKI